MVYSPVVQSKGFDGGSCNLRMLLMLRDAFLIDFFFIKKKKYATENNGLQRRTTTNQFFPIENHRKL